MILKNSIIIAVLSIVSVLLGMFRDRLLAEYVGIGVELDIYNAAFRLPDLALGILLSFAASATIIPFLSKAIDQKDNLEIERRMSTLFVFFGISMAVLSIIVVSILPYIARFIVPGFSEFNTEQFILYTRILMLQPILLGLSTLVSTLAQSKHRFYLYGIAPLFYTLSIICSIIFGYKQYGTIALIVGVLVGSVLHFLLQSITLRLYKIRIRPSLFSWDLVKEQLHISLPRSFAYLIVQSRVVFFTALATTFGIGALSIYLFAQRIVEAVIQIIPQSISSASLPSLSLHSSREDNTAYKKLFVRNTAYILTSSTAIAFFIWFLAKYIVLVLFGDTGHNEKIIEFLLVLVLGLPFAALANYISTAFSARKETQIILYLTLCSTLVGIGTAYVLKVSGMGILSIAYGTVALSVVYVFLSGIFYIGRIQNKT
ncbi:MAG: hypothetical protein RI996_540 [Candidatus Parcubacteria bacterium]|jgi:putative peptidoglycan lipid II flippase